MNDRRNSPPRPRVLVLTDAVVFLLALVFIAFTAFPQARAAFVNGATPVPQQEALATPSPALPSDTPSPTPTPVPATPTPAPGDFSAAFAEAKLADGMDYVCECADYKIGIEEYYVGGAVALVADVFIRDIHVLKTAFANDSFNAGGSHFENILKLCAEKNAMFAVSGDYVSTRTDGLVFRNGELLRNTYYYDMCVLYVDGTMEVYSSREISAAALKNRGVWQTWVFGPNLLDQSGRCMEITHNLSRLNPRCAIGYYEPGHYCFVVVDGRQKYYSEGMTLTELSAFMESLGCNAAYNLDGGQTAQMVLDDGLVNQPINGGRRVGDMIYLERMETGG